jgi:hypothetical protein
VGHGRLARPRRYGPKAYAAGERFAEERVDLIFCHAATYATSSQVLPAVQEAGVPVVVLNLQPSSSLDYENTDTGEWLANCSTCCVPEISNAFERRLPLQRRLRDPLRRRARLGGDRRVVPRRNGGQNTAR